MRRSLLKASLVAVAMLASVMSPARADAATDPRYCFRAHVAGIGWQPWECHYTRESGVTPKMGTTGQNRAIEAVEAQAYGFDICLRAHMRNVGWGSTQCTSSRTLVASVGTTGRGIPLEALTITVRNDDGSSVTSRRITAVGHVQNIGWMNASPTWPALAKTVTVGTTGRGLNLEAVMTALY